MKIIQSPHLDALQRQAICLLWNKEYPAKLVYPSFAAFDEYLSTLSNQVHYMLVDEHHRIMGWACSFEREAGTWFAVIVDSSLHAKGYGTALLNRLKERHNLLNGWVIDHDRDVKMNGEPYVSPLPFYLKHDFRVIEGTRLETEHLSAVKIVWEKQ